MKLKLKNFSKSKQLLLLDVLDFLVDKGNMNIWSSISSKKFFQGLLDLLRTKDIPEVQMKLLGLIQKWGLNFEDKKSALPNFFSVYNKLRNNNVQFPNDFESNYQIYINNSNSNNKYGDNRNDDYENENNSDKEDGETFYYMESLKNKLKVPNFEHKYRRLVNFLVKMHDNIQMANLLMDSRERGGLKDIITTLREGNNTLIDTISGGRLKDEKLMEITLGTTEDINQTLNREEDIKNGYKPKKFTSYFVLNNVIPIKNSRTRAKSTRPKKSIQRKDERYKNYDMDINNGYNSNKYKEKAGKPKNVDDIFDLFSTSNPSNDQGYGQQQQPINNFFSSQTVVRSNNNNNNSQYPQLTNNPMHNIFNTNNNNRNTMMMSANNNNFGRQFNQNNNQQGPVMTNFDILEQKLNNLNFQQQNNNNFNNYNSQPNNTQFNPGFNNNNNMNNNNMNNNNMNNNNMNNNNMNNNNSNLMSMLDQLGPSPQGPSNQLVPYIGSFNNNQNNNNNNNNQFNNFNRNNSNQFNNNFNNNPNNNNSNFNNFNNQNNNMNNSQFNNNYNNQNQNNFGNNNNQMNFNNNMGNSQNMNNNNNFGMGQNNNQQMSYEEMEKQKKLKELDELF